MREKYIYIYTYIHIYYISYKKVYYIIMSRYKFLIMIVIECESCCSFKNNEVAIQRLHTMIYNNFTRDTNI